MLLIIIFLLEKLAEFSSLLRPKFQDKTHLINFSQRRTVVHIHHVVNLVVFVNGSQRIVAGRWGDRGTSLADIHTLFGTLIVWGNSSGKTERFGPLS